MRSHYLDMKKHAQKPTPCWRRRGRCQIRRRERLHHFTGSEIFPLTAPASRSLLAYGLGLTPIRIITIPGETPMSPARDFVWMLNLFNSEIRVSIASSANFGASGFLSPHPHCTQTPSSRRTGSLERALTERTFHPAICSAAFIWPAMRWHSASGRYSIMALVSAKADRALAIAPWSLIYLGESAASNSKFSLCKCAVSRARLAACSFAAAASFLASEIRARASSLTASWTLLPDHQTNN